MTAPLVSVVVASRHRPAELGLCLRALDLQDYVRMEIVVVADPKGLSAATATGIRHQAVAFDTANLSAARNLGIDAARGEFILFIDDDAVAEPTWVGRLLRILDDPAVVAATGPVLGSNGISLQWGLTHVDRLGLDHAEAGPDRVIKLLGTNMGFRAETLREVGGFDPAYRFYLDDADISRRIAAKGRIGFAPDAVVQHGFAPSAQRRADRVPVTLHDIGRSSAIFLRRHGNEAGQEMLRSHLWAEQSARISRHVTGQRISEAAGLDLMAGLETGWQEGLDMALSDLPEMKLAPLPPTEGQETRPGPRKGIVLSGRFWSRSRLEAEASELARDGWIVTVICLTPDFRAHRHRFDARGFWIQTGGIFGWSDRSGPRLVFRRFTTRIRDEVQRLSRTRPVAD
jgi:GT2 family glycosyltransferase